MTVEFPVTPGPHESVVMRLQGRLNMAVAPALRHGLAKVTEGGKTRLVLDLTDVESIDSAIVGSLIAGLKMARKSGGDLRIVGSSTQVTKVLTLTNLSRVLPTYTSVDDAFAT